MCYVYPLIIFCVLRCNDLHLEVNRTSILLGITYLQSKGEVEAYCASLNSKGIVHGLPTKDSNTFLYGASKVYKELSACSKVLAAI